MEGIEYATCFSYMTTGQEGHNSYLKILLRHSNTFLFTELVISQALCELTGEKKILYLREFTQEVMVGLCLEGLMFIDLRK